MTHASTDFAAHVLGLLKKTGPSGPTGPTPSNHLISNKKTGTTRRNEVGPVDTEWSQHLRVSGPAKRQENQMLTGRGTTGTGGTTIFQQGLTVDQDSPAPAEWHAILAELKRIESVDWLAVDRWREVISAAETFLLQWGVAAHSFGWTTRDLFGVHPVVPAARFDVMGLIPLIHDGAVVALTAQTATIRRHSGAVLTYRRCDQFGAVLISEVVHNVP